MAKKTSKTAPKAKRKTKIQSTKKKKTTTRAALKDPEGGLTSEGRRYFKKKQGANLKPGVKGKADTAEKMKRKGSFLRRHFANLRGPLKKENGEPTRLALSAHAWGEKVPANKTEAKKLAGKGTRLLESYHKKVEAKSAKKKSKSKAKTIKKKKKKTASKAKKKSVKKASTRTPNRKSA